MVDSSNLNGVGAAAADLEKGEVWEEDLEEETHETQEGRDSEKIVQGAPVYEIASSLSSLSEPLLTPEEAQHQGLAAASKPLVVTEKIIVSLLVVCFVLVEAYFVGRSFRHWIDNEHFHNDNGKLLIDTEFAPMPLPLELPVLVPIDGGGGGGGVMPSIAFTEPFEATLEGRSDSGELTVREMSESSPITKMSTRRTRFPPGLESTSPLLVLPLMMEEEAPIAANNDANGGGS